MVPLSPVTCTACPSDHSSTRMSWMWMCCSLHTRRSTTHLRRRYARYFGFNSDCFKWTSGLVFWLVMCSSLYFWAVLAGGGTAGIALSVIGSMLIVKVQNIG